MFKHITRCFTAQDFQYFPVYFVLLLSGFSILILSKFNVRSLSIFLLCFSTPRLHLPFILFEENSSKEEVFFKWKTKWNVCKPSFMLIYLFIFYIRGYPLRIFLFFLFSFRFSINNSQKFYHFSAKFISFFNRCSVFLDSMVFTSH